jgi:hypothetical protein
MRNPIAITVGGIEREVVCEIGLGLEIERKTGLGLITLAQRFERAEATLGQSMAVIEVALRGAGVAATADDMVRYAEADGLVDTVVTAGRIMNGFFAHEAKRAANGKAKKTAPLVATQ